MRQASLKQLSELTHSTLVGDPGFLICGVDELALATEKEASFCAHPKYFSLLEKTKAGVVCVDRNTPLLANKNYLISDHPSLTFQKLIDFFLKETARTSYFEGIHPSSVIHPTAQIGENVTIGPQVTIDAYCKIGANSQIGAGTVICAHVEIGTHVILYPRVTIREGCKLGNRVIIQSGAVIGSCGFGYTTTEKGEHLKQDQLGIVVLEDDVEIGANTTIDRARFKKTLISKGTKIDNLVQIGHNVELGPYNLIVSQTGISGSVKTGHHVVMGGQTGTVGHIEIAPQAFFAARSGIKKSIKKAGKYGGNPAISLDLYNREQVHLRKVAEYSKRLQLLEKQT